MRVQLRFTAPCSPAAAWDALTSPLELARTYAPFLTLHTEDALPDRWRPGDEVVVGLRLLGLVPVGRQLIAIRTRRRGGARILEDAGRPLTGPLAVVTSWRHRMAVSALPDGTTLYRDRLDVSAGLLTPLVWLALWGTWQLRATRLRRTMRGS